MLFVGRFFTFSNTEQKQAAIAGIDQRVNAFGNDRGTSRDRRCVNLVAAMAKLATMTA